jgi:hypothetical protein
MVINFFPPFLTFTVFIFPFLSIIDKSLFICYVLGERKNFVRSFNETNDIGSKIRLINHSGNYDP